MIKNLDELVLYLKENNLHISFAESLTGGLAAATLVNISGASNVLNESLVTYAPEAKMKYLKVKKETLDKYTVVSTEVASEMAEGLHELTGADICLSTTGVAGPSSDGINPVGKVCFGFYIKGKIETKEMHFGNIGRNEVRLKSVEYLFEELYKLL